ncbi:hypothetical protein EV421DRAFT_2041208 [Armillaria borealis]|uniref:Ricin B lectin domain-containing protein n=1 Tax=Armillaria borealis TaxID=47425 RepID=A0AA39IXU4_9AGAR|nr:hypothetical protein EV421DRAFT_2041208 [Armillaria borealis]
MFSSIILPVLLFTAATASPLVPRSTCHPVFENFAILTVSEYTGRPYGRFSWSSNPAVGSPVVASTSPSRWYVQQNGDYDPPTYTIKNVDNLLFDVELDGGVLVMDNIDWSGSNVNQKWKIECASCPTEGQTGVVAWGCNISPASSSANGLCVRQTGLGSQYDLAPCSSFGGSFYFSVEE